MKYKLNVQRDVDTDEPGVYILNLPGGFKFDEPGDCHTRGFDTMKELRDDVKNAVVPCSCDGCNQMTRK